MNYKCSRSDQSKAENKNTEEGILNDIMPKIDLMKKEFFFSFPIEFQVEKLQEINQKDLLQKQKGNFHGKKRSKNI